MKVFSYSKQLELTTHNAQLLTMHFHEGVDFSSVVEKQHMRNLVKENINTMSELNSLLQASPVKKKTRKPKSNTARGTSSAAGTSNSASTPVTPNLEALRNQAKQLRNANPDMLRTYPVKYISLLITGTSRYCFGVYMYQVTRQNVCARTPQYFGRGILRYKVAKFAWI